MLLVNILATTVICLSMLGGAVLAFVQMPGYVASPAAGIVGTVIASLVSLAYRDMVRRIEESRKATTERLDVIQGAQAALIQAVFALSLKLHPDQTSIILQHMDSVLNKAMKAGNGS